MKIPETDQAAWKTEPATVREMIDALLDVRRRLPEEEDDDDLRLPLVSLILRNGASFTGHVMGLREKEMEGAFLLVWMAGEAGGGRNPLAVVDHSEIASIVLRDADHFRAVRSRLLRGKPLGALQWKRQAADQSHQLSAVLGSQVEVELAGEGMDTDAMRGLSLKVVKQVAAQLQALAPDAASKETVAKAVGRIVLKRGVSDGVALDANRLLVDPEAIEACTPQEIRDALNRLF